MVSDSRSTTTTNCAVTLPLHIYLDLSRFAAVYKMSPALVIQEDILPVHELTVPQRWRCSCYIQAHHQAIEVSAALHTGLLVSLDVLSAQTPLCTAYMELNILTSSVSGYLPFFPYEIPEGYFSSNKQLQRLNVE